MFYESTYSGVTWLQLFGGWLLTGSMLVITCLAIAKAFSLSRHLKHLEWVRDSQWSAEDYGIMIRGLNDKVKSLESQLSRFKDRKRGKSGRFEKSEG